MDSLTMLIMEIRAGNHHAFGEIVRRFQDMAWASAFAQIGDAHLAQDAAQEAFVEAYLKLGDLREPEAFPGWFRRIVFKYADRQRRVRIPESKAPETFSEWPSQIPDPLTQTVHLEFRTSIHEAVDQLPEDLRLATILFHLDGYSQKEIAQYLGVPVSTIKKRLFDGRKKLKERLYDMAKENLKTQKPSNDDAFAEKIEFFIAMQENDLAQVEVLIKKNSELVHIKTEWTVASYPDYWPLNVTPIFWASATGNEVLVKLLLEHGAEIDAQDRAGNTPLHNAVLKSQKNIVQMFLKWGADLEAQSRSGMTALHIAALRDNREMIQFLIAEGAQVDVKDKQGHTPADWAALRGFQGSVDLLVSKGAKKPKGKIQKKVVVSTKKRTVPSAEKAIGRYFDAKGKTMDGLAPIDEVQPIYRSIEEVRSPILETGIKIIDLFCPLKRGGINGIFSPLSGVGRIFIGSQIMTSVDMLHNGYIVYLGQETEHHSAEGMTLQWRGEMGVSDYVLENKWITAFASIDADEESKQQLVEMGLTWAETYRAKGHEVLLVLETPIALTQGVLPYLRANAITAPHAAVTTLIDGDHTVGSEPEVFSDLDAVVTFDYQLGKQRLYPAVDPLVSKSNLLTNGAVAEEHVAVANEVQKLLNRYVGLHAQYEYNGFDALFYLHDRKGAEQTVIRARRLHRFLTQPLPGGEPFVTGLLGEHVALDDLLKGCREILDGKYDDVPEDAFFMVGTIEQALKKSKKLNK